MDGRLAPLLNHPVAPIVAAITLAMVALYLGARRARIPWAGLALRLLAVAGFVIPGWTIYRWTRNLAGARDAAESIPVDPGPVIETFVTSIGVLMAAGFALLVGGIHLARKLSAGGQGDGTR
ncbi:MAG TPA: hypothetical protein VFG78_13900 [Gemmatimonadota bacterium]|nr:hypothetical protein [Gemmatimonadota bacterium]